MIGFRGASRYYDPRYQDGFLLECQAMRQAREVMGLTNIKLMIPFCRTVAEGEKVLAVMEQAGLRRGQHGLEVYVMCEIPSNVVLAEDFARIFFRNAIAVGLPSLTVKGISEIDRGVDQISVSLDSGRVIVKSTGQEFFASPLPEKMREIINAGGIDGILKDLAKG